MSENKVGSPKIHYSRVFVDLKLLFNEINVLKNYFELTLKTSPIKFDHINQKNLLRRGGQISRTFIIIKFNKIFK